MLLFPLLLGFIACLRHRVLTKLRQQKEITEAVALKQISSKDYSNLVGEKQSKFLLGIKRGNREHPL